MTAMSWLFQDPVVGISIKGKDMGRKLIFFLSIIATQLIWAAAEIYRPAAEYLGKKAYEVDFTAGHFIQSALFDTNGDEVAQGQFDTYNKLDGDLSVRYGFGNTLELKGMARFRQVAGTRQVNNGEETFSVRGPESVGAGIKYVFKRQRNWRFAAEFEYRQSVYDNSDFAAGSTIPSTEDIILGDSGSEVSVTGHIAYRRTRNHYLAGALGYRAPSNSLSPELPYFAESVWPYKVWAFKLGVKGIFSLGGDDFGDTPTLKPLQNTGPTLLFNSINREMIAPYGGISYAFESFRVDFTGGQTVMGTSTDKGMEFLLGVVWRTKGTTRSDQKVASFKEYEIEASVLKVSPRGKFVKIDQGISSDVEKGMKFDIYQTDFFGGNVLVASGVIFEVGADWAIVRLSKKYKKVEIKKGFAARGL